MGRESGGRKATVGYIVKVWRVENKVISRNLKLGGGGYRKMLQGCNMSKAQIYIKKHDKNILKQKT